MNKSKQYPRGLFIWETLTVQFGGDLSKPENKFTAKAVKVPDFKHTVMERADAGGGSYYSYKEPVEYRIDNAFIILKGSEILGWMRVYKDIKKPFLLPIDKRTPEPVINFSKTIQPNQQ